MIGMTLVPQVGHLARALWLNHDPGICHMAWFNSYYDTSGPAHKDDVVVTSGLIATEKKWSNVERRWLARLGEAGLDHFHLTDILNHFGGDRGAADNLTVDLAKIIREVTGKFMVSVDCEQFHEMDQKYQLTEVWHSPFVMAAGLCVFLADTWLSKTHEGQGRAHFHEDGEAKAEQDALTVFLRDHCGVLVNFWPKRDPHTGVWIVPLQANDLMAGQQRRVFHALTKQRAGFEFSRTFLDIVQKMKVERFHCDRDGIETLAADHPGLFPARIL